MKVWAFLAQNVTLKCTSLTVPSWHLTGRSKPKSVYRAAKMRLLWIFFNLAEFSIG